MGIVSALGNNVEENLQSLQENNSGIAPLQYLQTKHSSFPVGEVKLSNEMMMNKLNFKSNIPHTRTALMGMLAVKEALINASLLDVRHETPDTSILNSQISFINGNTVGGMDKTEQYYLDFMSNNSCDEYIAIHDCGACSEMIADYFGDLFCHVQTISTACSSAANAIMAGAMLINSGKADIVVAGGCECITKFHLNGFNTLMILDSELCKPFDANRRGINLGEGAAYIVMEREETFKMRYEMCAMRRSTSLITNFKPLCRLSGYANTCDAFHQTASSPDGEGAYRAMKQAIEVAGLQPEQIHYINAHGTGTENNDLSEGIAIMRLFGKEIPPVSSTKSFTGHATSAAGSIEAVISILALQHNFIPKNLNFSKKMPELSFVPYYNMRQLDMRSEKNSNTKSQIRHVLTNSFGFGGNNTSLIFSKI